MQLFKNDKTVAAVYERSLSLAIGKEFTLLQNGKVANAAQQGSEQTFRRRELLAVEEKAQQDKIIKEHGKHHFKLQVMEKFYARVLEKFDSDFENKEHLFNSILAIESAAPDILEILAVKAASVNRITPLAKSLPWLANDVVNLVNKPQYRKRADVQVTEPGIALSYIGLDNLKLILPTFILKHWLPASTSPFGLLKRKLWNDSLSIALATQALAKEVDGIDDFTAFTAGMLSNLGVLAVTRCFLNTHNEMYNAELKEAYDNRDKKLHNIMSEFNSCPELLLEQLSKYSTSITADMVELMRFDRLQITEAMFDLAYAESTQPMCKLAKIIAKAKAYVAFRNLAKADLIESDEAKKLLSSVKLTPSNIELLKSTDIDHLKLNFK
ncbi:HDOD domain-containing protein [Thalassotalea sp. PLHSN55]|uniref:HDOD domain-containing protein n=1 Tax=Thalassotalea sp. PLHSN55 TaxID=3435888 RepID=UPI003F85DEF3